MQKLPKTVSIHARVVYGQYTERRCRRAGFDDLSDRMKTSKVTLLALARIVEDQAFPEQDAIADRDEVGDDLLHTARTLRTKLLARDSDEAVPASEKLFGKVYPDGMEPFDSIKLGEHTLVYGLLGQRVEKILDPADALRTETLARLDTLLGDWKAAVDLVEDARQVVTLAREERDAAVAAWEESVEYVYGILVSRVGKTRAERFFKKSKEAPAPAAVVLPE